MVTVTGLGSWIQLEKQIKPMKADPEGLAVEPEKITMETGGKGSTRDRQSAEVQKLVMVTKARDPYFLDPE